MPHETRIAYFEHAQDILEATISLIQSGQRCALVASLSIEGQTHSLWDGIALHGLEAALWRCP